ncbi:MAG: FxLYD domain-containing protein [Clostridiales bacterium]|nr:FxLYD domain-containing protein [Clostridiales bacterium]
MKKFAGILCTILMLLCVSFTFVGCIDFDDDDKKSSLSVSNENISIEYTEYLGYSVKITGSISNTTGKDLSYISVEYKIYDSSNAVIGTALANANSIGAGETWKFEASSLGWFDDRPTSVKLSKIQTLKDF